MPEYDGERQTVILDPGLVQKAFWEIIQWGSGSSFNVGIGNSVKIEGRGSTGRTIPNNLEEQIAMYQVQSNPLEGATKLPFELKDERWKASEGWVKMQSVVKTANGNKIKIHYVYNEVTGAFDDFKFK